MWEYGCYWSDLYNCTAGWLHCFLGKAWWRRKWKWEVPKVDNSRSFLQGPIEYDVYRTYSQHMKGNFSNQFLPKIWTLCGLHESSCFWYEILPQDPTTAGLKPCKNAPLLLVGSQAVVLCCWDDLFSCRVMENDSRSQITSSQSKCWLMILPVPQMALSVKILLWK